MTYSERLSAPLHYWLIGLFFGLTFATAVGFYLGPWIAVLGGLLTLAGIAGFLVWIGRTRISVDPDGLRVGPSLLEWRYVGPTTIRDHDGTRRRLGPDADVRAHVVERPYVPGSVEIALTDPADPHPYWLVSSRRPAELAVAIDERRTGWSGSAS